MEALYFAIDQVHFINGLLVAHEKTFLQRFYKRSLYASLTALNSVVSLRHRSLWSSELLAYICFLPEQTILSRYRRIYEYAFLCLHACFLAYHWCLIDSVASSREEPWNLMCGICTTRSSADQLSSWFTAVHSIGSFDDAKRFITQMHFCHSQFRVYNRQGCIWGPVGLGAVLRRKLRWMISSSKQNVLWACFETVGILPWKEVMTTATLKNRNFRMRYCIKYFGSKSAMLIMYFSYPESSLTCLNKQHELHYW